MGIALSRLTFLLIHCPAMNKNLLILAMTFVACGCQNESANQPKPTASMPMSQPTILKTIRISGFDPDGEPEIRMMSDGTIYVVLNFVPPSWAEADEKRFADFDNQLERGIGVPVYWEDREFFLIRKPAKDTAEKIQSFLQGYRKTPKQ